MTPDDRATFRWLLRDFINVTLTFRCLGICTCCSYVVSAITYFTIWGGTHSINVWRLRIKGELVFGYMGA
jgi:hypothetical protein